MRGRRLLGLLLVMQVGLVIAGLVVWTQVPAAPAPATVVPTAVPTGLTSLESASPVAGAAAAAWLPGARLMHAALQIDWPWEAPPPGETEPVPATGWVDYVFAAPWTGPGRPPGGATLSVLVERLSGAIVFQSSLAWETMPQVPSPPADTAVTSLEAAAAAEAAGGAAFRYACPVYRHVSRVSLVTPASAPPHWLVTYEDTRQPDRHGLMITVNAATGATSTTGGTAPECKAASDFYSGNEVRW
jgi:hypothetical protein